MRKLEKEEIRREFIEILTGWFIAVVATGSAIYGVVKLLDWLGV